MDKDKKIVVNFEGLKMETTLGIIEDNDMNYEEDYGEIIVYIDDGRLDQAVLLEPNSFFVETIMYELKSGCRIDFESNYKVPKDQQNKIVDYQEEDNSCHPYISSWTIYYNTDEEQTFDKKIIKKIDEEFDESEDCSPNGLSIQRLDPLDFLKPMRYYDDMCE
jgi:hypothetical protein